ncbi:MAG: HAD family hydrolase [Patescibacteria group bacterium]
MSKYRLAVFDWNGTLLNDLSLVYASVQKIFRVYKLTPPTLEQYCNEISADFMQFYWSHGMPQYVTKDDLNKIRQDFFTLHWNNVFLNNDVYAILGFIIGRGLNISITSGEESSVLEERMKQFSLKPLFDLVRGSAWNKEVVLKETLQYFNILPSEAVYIDDTFDGITAAKNVGMDTIGFTGGYNSRERILVANPNFIIDSLDEIIRLSIFNS